MQHNSKKIYDKYNYFHPQNDSREIISHEFGNLLAEFEHLTAQNYLLESEVEYLEHIVDEFLMEYYEQVSAVILENPNLLNSKKQTEEEDNFYATHKLADAEEFELKRIYRRLVKKFHPDSNANGSNAEVFRKIQELYLKKDLGELIKLETGSNNSFEKSGNVVNDIEKLEKEIKTLEKSQTNLLSKKRNLVNSSEYKLLLKVRWHKMLGEDLIKDIVDSLGAKLPA
jgi:hypothetical protein